jgi:hypothetical protein
LRSFNDFLQGSHHTTITSDCEWDLINDLLKIGLGEDILAELKKTNLRSNIDIVLRKEEKLNREREKMMQKEKELEKERSKIEERGRDFYEEMFEEEEFEEEELL